MDARRRPAATGDEQDDGHERDHAETHPSERRFDGPETQPYGALVTVQGVFNPLDLGCRKLRMSQSTHRTGGARQQPAAKLRRGESAGSDLAARPARAAGLPSRDAAVDELGDARRLYRRARPPRGTRAGQTQSRRPRHRRAPPAPRQQQQSVVSETGAACCGRVTNTASWSSSLPCSAGDATSRASPPVRTAANRTRARSLTRRRTRPRAHIQRRTFRPHLGGHQLMPRKPGA